MDQNPYSSPSNTCEATPFGAGGPRLMSRFERLLVLAHLVGVVLYVPCFVAAAWRMQVDFGAPAWTVLMTVHFFMVFLGLVVFVVMVRDLYLRDYFTANQKLTWALLFCLLTPSIWVYFFRHAWKPRNRVPA